MPPVLWRRQAASAAQGIFGRLPTAGSPCAIYREETRRGQPGVVGQADLWYFVFMAAAVRPEEFSEEKLLDLIRAGLPRLLREHPELRHELAGILAEAFPSRQE